MKPHTRKLYDHFPGKTTHNRLIGVKPRLVEVVVLGMRYSTLDFGVSEGKRTLERQKQLYRQGKSRTMKSRHLDGEAVDIYVSRGKDNGYNFEQLCECMKGIWYAAEYFDVLGKMRWGGVWDRRLDKLNPEKLLDEHKAYVKRFRSAKGRSPLVDLPHIEFASNT